MQQDLDKSFSKNLLTSTRSQSDWAKEEGYPVRSNPRCIYAYRPDQVKSVENKTQPIKSHKKHTLVSCQYPGPPGACHSINT